MTTGRREAMFAMLAGLAAVSPISLASRDAGVAIEINVPDTIREIRALIIAVWDKLKASNAEQRRISPDVYLASLSNLVGTKRALIRELDAVLRTSNPAYQAGTSGRLWQPCLRVARALDKVIELSDEVDPTYVTQHLKATRDAKSVLESKGPFIGQFLSSAAPTYLVRHPLTVDRIEEFRKRLAEETDDLEKVVDALAEEHQNSRTPSKKG